MKIPRSTQHRLINNYHLPEPKINRRVKSLSMENRPEVGGSNQRLRQAKNYLWQGLIDDAIAVFDDLKKKPARNFQNYLRKHMRSGDATKELIL